MSLALKLISIERHADLVRLVRTQGGRPGPSIPSSYAAVACTPIVGKIAQTLEVETTLCQVAAACPERGLNTLRPEILLSQILRRSLVPKYRHVRVAKDVAKILSKYGSASCHI